MTKLVFMGTPAFSATVLEGLLTDERYDIVAVVTQPDRAVGRKKEIRMTPVKEVALAAEIAYYGTTGNEAAMPPVDPHDLDRCLRVVNSAVRDFISKAPPGGSRISSGASRESCSS